MAKTELLIATDLFRILIVDDEADTLNDVKQCFGSMEGFDVVLIEKPEEIENYQITEKTYHLVVLDIRFREQGNVIQYLLTKTKEAWPDAIIVILSNYDDELSPNERDEADIVLNKAKLIAEPNLLCNRVKKILPKHRILSNPIAARFFKAWAPVKPPVTKELLRMNGLVTGKEGEHLKVVIFDPPDSKENRRRKLLLPYDMFRKKGLEVIGTYFIFRMTRLGDNYKFAVMRDDKVNKSAQVPNDINEHLKRLEKKELDQLKGLEGCDE